MLVWRLILHFPLRFLSLISRLVILMIIICWSILYLVNSFGKFHHIALKNNIFGIITAARYRLPIIIALVIGLIDLLGLWIVLIICDCFLFYCVGITYSADDLLVLVLELLYAMFELLEFFGKIYFLLFFVKIYHLFYLFLGDYLLWLMHIVNYKLKLYSVNNDKSK